MKRIDAIMILSLIALGLSFVMSLLAFIFYFNLSGRLNTFIKQQVNVNTSLIESVKSGQDIQKQILDVIKEYTDIE